MTELKVVGGDLDGSTLCVDESIRVVEVFDSRHKTSPEVYVRATFRGRYPGSPDIDRLLLATERPDVAAVAAVTESLRIFFQSQN